MKINIYGAFKNDSDDDEAFKNDDEPTNAITEPTTYNDTTATTEPSYDACLIPQEIMGLVFLAFGTSLPELITCVIVAKIGKADIAIAGAVASNILNILVGLLNEYNK